MEWSEVLARIERGENDETEFKRWDAFPARVADAVCAMANSSGGLIILGVSDDGTLVGVSAPPDDVQERLTSLLHTGLSGPVSASLGCHESSDGWVHWIEVPFLLGLEPLRSRGRVLVRRGRASVEPSGGELQELFNTFGFVLTEEQGIPDSGAGDIDLESFRAYLTRQGLDVVSEPQPDIDQDLVNRAVLTWRGAGLQATLYGILCFGREPQRFRHTGQFFIQCSAYAGTDRASDVILTGEARGRVDEQVSRALGWLKALGTREIYEGILRKDVPLVPERAAREALVNAVAHRDYTITGSKVLLEVFRDRLVVTSPGTLPNSMKPASVLAGGHPRSRNELLANFLLVSRLMEGRGRGLPIIRREMREFNGTNPELIDERDGRYVRLTLRLAPAEV